MNSARNMTKLTFSIASLSLIVSFIVGLTVVWANLSFTLGYQSDEIFKKSFIVTFCVVFFGMVLLSSWRMSLARKLIEIRENEDFSENYFTELNRQICFERNKSVKALKIISLACAYEQVHNFENAFETLRKLDVSRLNSKLKALYFNAAIYFYLMAGDIESANFALQQGREYIEKYRYSQDYGPSITHTLAAFEYYIGNLQKAENTLMLVKSTTINSSTILSCDLFLAMIYLRTNRKEYARDLVLQDLINLKTKRQKEDFSNLMKEIEAAFAESGQ